MMKSNILKLIVAIAVFGTVLVAYSYYQSSKAWVISYEVAEGQLEIEATSSGSKKHIYTTSTSMPEVVGKWNTSDPPPREIEVLFSDYTIQPGRVIFRLNEEQFDLMQRGLFPVEPD